MEPGSLPRPPIGFQMPDGSHIRTTRDIRPVSTALTSHIVCYVALASDSDVHYPTWGAYGTVRRNAHHYAPLHASCRRARVGMFGGVWWSVGCAVL